MQNAVRRVCAPWLETLSMRIRADAEGNKDRFYSVLFQRGKDSVIELDSVLNTTRMGTSTQGAEWKASYEGETSRVGRGFSQKCLNRTLGKGKPR